MSTFDNNGLVMDRFDDIKTALIADLKAAFGDTIKTTSDSVFGQFINIFSEAIADQNETIEGIASAFNPQSASGFWLSVLVLLNGIRRKENEYSTTALRCTANTAGATIDAGNLVSNSVAKKQFKTDIDIVVPPSSFIDVSATAVEAGAIEAPSGTLTQIDTPVYGWESVTNIVDATVGNIEESDPLLRLRRRIASEKTGSAGTAAVYSAIYNIDAVEDLNLLENKDDVTDSNGVPSHSFWLIVLGASDVIIAETLFKTAGGGVGFKGAIAVVYNDPITGQSQTIRFDRPTEVDNYITLRIIRNVNYPSDGDDQIKQAIVNYYDEYFKIGDDVEYSRLYTPINSIPGFTVKDFLLDTSFPAGGQSNIPIAPYQKGVIDSSDINIEYVSS